MNRYICLCMYFHIFKKTKSESKHPEQKKKFDKSNELAELLSKIVHFFIVIIGVPGVTLPKAFLSYYKYFTTDAQSDAFELTVSS